VPYDGDDRYQPGSTGRGHRSRSRERYPPVVSGDRDRDYGREGVDRGRGVPPGRWEDRGGHGSSPPGLRDPLPTSGGRMQPGGGGANMREARESTPPHRGPIRGASPGRGRYAPDLGSTRHGPPPPSQRMDPYGLETYSHAGAPGHRHGEAGVLHSERGAPYPSEPGYAPYRGGERGGYGAAYDEPVAASRGGGYPRDAYYPAEDVRGGHHAPQGAPRRHLSPDGAAPAYYETSGAVGNKAAPPGYGGRGGAPYEGDRGYNGAAAEPGYRGSSYAPRGGYSNR
jgi:hypothetical protein